VTATDQVWMILAFGKVDDRQPTARFAAHPLVEPDS
jgi:hypothetical protein